MKLDELMGIVIDELYAGLTGGDAELPIPQNTMINWMMPSIVMHESEFDFAIAGPFAGPSPLTLPFFKTLVDAIKGDAPGMDQAQAVAEAKAMYQSHLLGTWENWSRMVDFIPLDSPGGGSRWERTRAPGSKYKHTQVVYAQAGRTLSQTYADTLNNCEVADDQLTGNEQKIIERMRALLQEEVEVENFLTGAKTKEIRPSKATLAYEEYRTKYENAVIDYAARLARSQTGSAADRIEWNRSGGIYRARAKQALQEWVGRGFKNDIETAHATIDQILGTSMLLWWNRLKSDVDAIDNNVSGSFGYPFFPATVVPGSFARNPNWAVYDERHVESHTKSTSSARQGSAAVGFSLGLFNVGAAGGGGREDFEVDMTGKSFGIKFDYTQVQIVRPAFNANWFWARGWRPKPGFELLGYPPLHSNGAEHPEGAMIAYPTAALFARNLTLYSSEVAAHVKQHADHIEGGGFVGIGPFTIGGKYGQTNNSSEQSFTFDGSSVTMNGIQLMAFISTKIPKAADPSPDIKKWVGE
ncbi:hypothetical protein [Streptomyces sp. NPDC001315]|uniref:hypothetical protein n=1 Tax=Streptomyces sp. NPDC001315 TaxID=3364562 RepID=UPI00368DB41C